MAIVIFGDMFSFPEGDASTNRVHTYAKGITENGINVHVICFANEYNSSGDGLMNGIYYYHPFGQRKRNKFLIIRQWQKFIKYFKAIALVKRINHKDEILSIVVYSLRLSNTLFAWYLSRISKAKLIKECSEHPFIHYQNSALSKKQGLIKFKIESRLCDGVFCISRFLVDFFMNNGVHRRKLFLLPSTVDPTRFFQYGESPFSFKYVGYFGGLTFYRDNIDILIKAFTTINNKYPELHLVLGGFCSDNEKKQIENLIAELDMSAKIELLKYLSREEIIRYITHSDILVMVRARDMETQASFPSKLTEYLSTSKPVITVNVGEISDYLTNGVNSFLIEPGNIKELADKLDYVLTNYDSALEIAKQGKDLTSNIFNYNFQAKRIIRFIETL